MAIYYTDNTVYFSSSESLKVAGTIKVEGEKKMEETNKNKTILEQFEAGECLIRVSNGFWSHIFNYYMYKKGIFEKEAIEKIRPYSYDVTNHNYIARPTIHISTCNCIALLKEEKVAVEELARELFLSGLGTYGIIVNSEQEAKAVCVWLHDNGRLWTSGESYLTRTNFQYSSIIIRNNNTFEISTQSTPTDFYATKFFTMSEINELAARFPETEAETKKQEFYHVSDKTKHNILSSFEKCLNKYGWNYKEKVLQDIINLWEEQKQPLFRILSKHPNWVDGKCYIHFDANYKRTFDLDVLREFANWVYRTISYSVLPEEVENFKDKAKELMTENYKNCILQYHSHAEIITKFFYTILDLISSSKVDKEMEEWMSQHYPELKCKEGQKISRLINKYCTKIGLDKLEGYNREFAKCADGLNPVSIKRHTVISLNPVDYLMMSNGNSWASCHTIDTLNIEDRSNGYDGCYCGGTMSYMLDPSSFVYYTVDGSADGENLEKEYKTLRQMFHYCDYKLLQARLYPQSNDSNASTELKANIRAIMQKIFADSLGIDNLWTVTTKYEEYVQTDPNSLHYKDYNEYRCYMSYPKGMELNFTNTIYIGHETLCIECGGQVVYGNTINCCSGRPENSDTCYDCGGYYHPNDLYYCNYDGEYRCCDCCVWSDTMESYISSDAAVRVDDDYVTEWEADHSSNIFWCEHCEEYHFTDVERYVIQDTQETVCENCIDNYYHCEKCDEYYSVPLVTADNGEEYCPECYQEYLDEKNDENEEEALKVASAF